MEELKTKIKNIKGDKFYGSREFKETVAQIKEVLSDVLDLIEKKEVAKNEKVVKPSISKSTISKRKSS